MTLLSDVIQLKQSERENELRDISAIGSSVENFITIKRDAETAELNRRNIESQIATRERVDPLSKLITRGKAIDAAKTIADTTGDTTALDTLRNVSRDPKDFLSDPVADITPSIPPTVTPSVDEFLPGQEISPAQAVLPTVGEGVERLPSGDISEIGKVQLGLQEKKAAAVITGEAAVDVQELKEGAKVRRNLSSGDLKLDLTLGEFFKFGKEQQELLGLPAGPLAGALSKITSAVSAEAKNRFLAAFEGSRIELAAFVGRNAMPGTRAARIIDLFRQTTPSPFDTISSGIRNAAVSWGETIATDFGANRDEYIPGYSDMSIEEQRKARKDILKPYVNEQIKVFEDTYTIEAYKVSPEMFTEKDRVRAEQLVREDIRNRLRGR